MLCPKCGALIADDSVFCSKCGIALKKTATEVLQPLPVETAPVPAQPVQTSTPDVVQNAPLDPGVQNTRQQAREGGLPPMPNTYLTQNILLTVFAVICCITVFALPTAVTGLVFSAIAQGAFKQNDMEKVRHCAKLARIFMWISFGIEIATAVVYIVFLLLGVISLANVFQNIFKGSFNFDMDQLQDFKDGIWR